MNAKERERERGGGARKQRLTGEFTLALEATSRAAAAGTGIFDAAGAEEEEEADPTELRVEGQEEEERSVEGRGVCKPVEGFAMAVAAEERSDCDHGGGCSLYGLEGITSQGREMAAALGQDHFWASFFFFFCALYDEVSFFPLFCEKTERLNTTDEKSKGTASAVPGASRRTGKMQQKIGGCNIPIFRVQHKPFIDVA